MPFHAISRDLNTFWQRALGAIEASYCAPTVKTLAAPVVTACGPAGPEHFAFYCPAEEAIYYAPAGLDAHRRRIGDFAPIVVMAHEWGHHVQTVLGIAPGQGNTFELYADCLAGAYTSDAGQRGLLDPGDLTETVAMSATAEDPLGLPQDMPGAHGINEDRIAAFMRGLLRCSVLLFPVTSLPRFLLCEGNPHAGHGTRGPRGVRDAVSAVGLALASTGWERLVHSEIAAEGQLHRAELR
jgi:predicted metalloprotease